MLYQSQAFYEDNRLFTQEGPMSRYRLAPRNRRHEVDIGWDRPLFNFFLQVRDLDIDEDKADPMVVWLGADGFATETAVDPVLDEASRWAMIPEGMRVRLLSDRRTESLCVSQTIEDPEP